MECYWTLPWLRSFLPAAYNYVLGVEDAMLVIQTYDQDGPIASRYANLLNYELVAPGTAIMSTIPGGGYQHLNRNFNGSSTCIRCYGFIQSDKPDDSKELIFGNLINTSSTL